MHIEVTLPLIDKKLNGKKMKNSMKKLEGKHTK